MHTIIMTTEKKLRSVEFRSKAIFLLILSSVIAVSDAYYHGGHDTRPILVNKVLIYAFLLWIFFLFAERLASCIQPFQVPCSWHSFFQNSKKNILCLSLLLFAVYLIYLFVFYPGTCGSDTVNQITDLMTGTEPMPNSGMRGRVQVSALMNDHHPVVTTLIFTLFYRIGLILGDANRGMFLYNLLQIAVLSFLFASVICSMDRFNVPKPIALLSAVYYASPLVAFFTITVIKDTLFSLFFLLYYLVFLGMMLNASSSETPSPKQWLLLGLMSVLISLTNKKGIYLALLSNCSLLFLLHGRKKILALISAFFPFLLVTVIMGQFLFPLLNIFPGGKQEALGFAFQQTALSMIERPESFSEEEQTVFFSMLDLSPAALPDAYEPDSTDSIKSFYRFDAPDDLLPVYIKQWFLHFFRTPGPYIRAMFSVCGGFFAPVKDYPDVYMEIGWNDRIQAFTQPASHQNAREILKALFFWFHSLPIVRLFSQDSFYMFWFPSFSAWHFYRRRQWKYLIMLTPLAANIPFLLMGPICWTRYGLCQLYTFPVLLAITFMPQNNMLASMTSIYGGADDED